MIQVKNPRTNEYILIDESKAKIIKTSDEPFDGIDLAVVRRANKKKPILDTICTRKKLSYKDRIDWFCAMYYETGMHYESVFESLKNEDLNKVPWYDGFVKIPEYEDEL